MKNVISFDSARIAEGYKKRPFLHGQVIEQFTERIGQNRFHRGIDIGCGAGLSTKALSPGANNPRSATTSRVF